MAAPKSKKQRMSAFRVTYTVTIRGTMIVEASAADMAKQKVINEADFPDIAYPATCEMIDWEAEEAVEEP